MHTWKIFLWHDRHWTIFWGLPDSSVFIVFFLPYCSSQDQVRYITRLRRMFQSGSFEAQILFSICQRMDEFIRQSKFPVVYFCFSLIRKYVLRCFRTSIWNVASSDKQVTALFFNIILSVFHWKIVVILHFIFWPCRCVEGKVQREHPLACHCRRRWCDQADFRAPEHPNKTRVAPLKSWETQLHMSYIRRWTGTAAELFNNIIQSISNSVQTQFILVK